MMTLDAVKSNINYLIEQYEQHVMLLKEDIKDGSIGNVFLCGQLRASMEILDHLRDLVDENNYEE